MKKIIDARGKQCPIPVILAKDAMKEEKAVEIVVDNEIAVQNLMKLAKQKNYQMHSEKKEDVFVVNLTKEEEQSENIIEEPVVCQKDTLSKKIVVISSEVMGQGDDVLGNVLMKGFIYALTQMDVLPSCVIFYNGGLKLACKGSAVLEDLKTLESLGVEILSCGTCLSHYGLVDEVAIGQVTNMYEIVERQMLASGVIRP
ncbi:hypothetical protein A9CBEGH2_15250 [Amedibacterium intestinale]|uniref:sulfurtransferase-like selenium metabolism protein YedF n=1 Tax=Amedibacterium intestinale TaxID=2583452 RepID=UPI001373A53E|nr:sulfurtransferase-like selenium metabolism protein YedF [Amedibacterium intestinale]BBK62585.1 hypothetical protein A9CBEGH2_15250 [Amedibacterium intestinale]